MKDYGIAKISFADNKIETIICAKINSVNNCLEDFEERDRNWLTKQIKNGKTFCTLIKLKNNKWKVCDDVSYDASKDYCAIGYTKIPKNIVRRKTFISYQHLRDNMYKRYFENLFGDLIINKSVEDGDIDSDNSAEYIKHLIQKEYLNDTTVLIVLLGAKTQCRKHVDWEISGALNYKVGKHYSGLLGIVLPTHPDYGKPMNQRSEKNFPKRFFDNYKSKYAVMIDWTEDRAFMQNAIEKAFCNRSLYANARVNDIPQMKRNTGM